MKKEEYLSAIEAILFVSNKPITIGRLREELNISADTILELLMELEKNYKNRGINVVLTKKGYTFAPNEKYRRFFSKFIERKHSTLSRQSLEVIAILLNEGKATKEKIDKLRGVNSARMIHTLLKKGYIKKIRGKDNFYYSITDSFIKNMKPEVREAILNRTFFKKGIS